jgi:glycosyltransferase involved in cell wall biosynthesis
MKITIVLGAFFPVPPLLGGAVEKVWFALGQEFVRQGHAVVQVSRNFPGMSASEEIEGVRHLRVRGYAQPLSVVRLKWLDLLYSLRVRRVLPPADILVTNTFWLPLLVRRKDHGRVYVHVARAPKGQMHWYSRAARLQAVSRAVADQIVAQAPQLAPKVSVIPNPVSFPLEPHAERPREQTILYVGRIHPEKGIELLLRGIRLLPADLRSHCHLRIVGPHEVKHGGGGESFLRQMQELGRESGAEVAWLGKFFEPDQLAEEYLSALIFVYPSIAERGEAFGLAPLEAMAAGCVPLVSKLDCFCEFIVEGENGFVFDHRVPEPERNLAAHLQALLEMDRDRLKEIGQAARAKAAEFELAKIARLYLRDFERLLS